MKKCIYPLLIYTNKEEQCYIGLFPDLDISTYGATVEEAYLESLLSLETYLKCAAKFETEVPAPTSFEDSVKMNPKRVVLLSSVEINADNLVLTESDQEYKKFLQNMLVEG